MRAFVVIEPSSDVQQRCVKKMEFPYLSMMRHATFTRGSDGEFDMLRNMCWLEGVFYNDYLFFFGSNFLDCLSADSK